MVWRAAAERGSEEHPGVAYGRGFARDQHKGPILKKRSTKCRSTIVFIQPLGLHGWATAQMTFLSARKRQGVPPTLTKPDDSSAQPGKYKDQRQRIKRQGARFRIYAYTEDAAGTVTKVQEITSAEAQIEWEVHLANHKAAAPKFDGTGRRNGGKPESDLIIDPGPQRISGANQAMKKVSGTFMKTMSVDLGDLLTEASGRLIVLGGHGKSQSLPQSQLTNFADNDGWCDDVADGPVRATIRLNGSAAPIAADPAWVIVAPPDFAPPIENVVTLL
jgi:L-lysine epsilon oxidase-like protein